VLHKGISSDSVIKHHLKRAAWIIVGVVLFYAPFALIVKMATIIFPGASLGTVNGDVHQACLRMPISWLAQPQMLLRVLGNPLYLIVLVALPVTAFLFAPVFCGWLCPAGGFTEYLSRLVPDRFKLDFRGKVDFTPIRYGFLSGLIVTPLVTSSICCSFCNFGYMQNFVSAGFGDFSSFAYWSSTGIITLVLWLFFLGIFTKGGRGWCNFLCPAGAIQGLFSRLGMNLPWVYRIRHDKQSCSSCATCENICPPRSIERSGESLRINPYTCNACLDCVVNCPSNAISYKKGKSNES